MRLLEIRWANSIIQLALGASELSRAILGPGPGWESRNKGAAPTIHET